ncbi:MAG: aminoglycoside phosphotransferase family protein [Cyanobacteria bacterium K_DeepCast_35m_m2_023]|nr:aminoglycoside phosphotransferase family protein [Cyanobacteria bacterium K_DeepCast_35m_m2_023]
MDPRLLAELAACFALDSPVSRVEPLGNGNVNATFRVQTEAGRRYVLQRLNRAVFTRPDLVMANLQALTRHAAPKLDGVWPFPRPVPLEGDSTSCLLHHQGEPWRLLTHIDDADSIDVIEHPDQAREIGLALGRFHALIHDLPAEQLADTLEGFHVTPGYYARYLDQRQAPASAPLLREPQALWCDAFIAERAALVPVLEQARSQGRLQLRPIHGDPKVNNVMLCSSTGCAVAMVDLDTVKPGLVHYDIGDALRSACNPAGEESRDLNAVHFDLTLAAAMLEGYLHEAGTLLSEHDFAHLYDAIRLIPFELGLRFFSDHLAADVYFKTDYSGHNLARALVQFRLTESIEAQEQAIRDLITCYGSRCTRTDGHGV